MFRGHQHYPIYSISIYAPFSGQFFFKFSQKKIVMGKKIIVPCLDDRPFAEKYTIKFSQFCPKSERKY